ncbi:MAG: regulator, partial [Proteobacteria bacterium]|nr:regulator [Pseudomonadota bacterium]
NVVCKTIRSNPTFEHVKIIVISGVINREEIDAMLADGADEFIQKPFEIDHVIRRMAALTNA